MKHYSLLLIVFAILTLSSCMSTKPLLNSNVKPSEVTDLQYFEPTSYIALIESGNKLKYNDTISKKSEELILKTVKGFEGKIPVTNIISVSDTIIEKELEFLCIKADRQKNIENLKITPIIDSLLETKGKRFGLITVASGFTRVKGNYEEEIAKGLAMGILTLGMYYQTPIKSKSTIYVMIVDSKENNVVFFNKSILQDKDPLDETVLKKQFQKIFEGYYWPKE